MELQRWNFSDGTSAHARRFLQGHAEHQTMWFDRNGWIVITPIALILIIGAAMLRPSDTPREPHVSTAMVGNVLDWPEATGSSAR